MAGKQISIDFDGVFDNSYVYLNGHLLGNHPYGYTGYSYDITGLAHADGHTRNVLAVVVQNQEPSSRWYSGSGITRHVHLTVVDPVHIARWGTFVTTPNLASTIKSGYADVHVATQLADDGAPRRPCASRTRSTDPRGTPWRDRPRNVPAPPRPARRPPRRPPATCGRRPKPNLYTRDKPTASSAATAPARRSGSAGSTFDPNNGIIPQRQTAQDPRRRPAQRRGRARIGRQLRRAVAPDERAQGDGRQRVPHVTQPAVAGDDRRLPATRDRDDGRGVRHLDVQPSASSRTTTTCTSTSGATTTSRRWSTRPRTRRP